MGKTVRRDKAFWWEDGLLPTVKNFDGRKCRREKDCKPGCRVCGRGPVVKRERMKKIRSQERLDIDEQM